MPLIRDLLSASANVNVVLAAIHRRVHERFPEMARVASRDPTYFTLKNPELMEVFEEAMERFGPRVGSPENLGAANLFILGAAFKLFAADLPMFMRHRHYLHHGVNPTMAGRPEIDHEALDNYEMKHLPAGTALSFRPNMAESLFGGTMKTFDQFHQFVGIAEDGTSRIREVTDSDAYRVKVIPWAPVPTRIPGAANMGPVANGHGLGSDPVLAARATAYMSGNSFV